jgi:hypothetical protein
MSLINDDNTMSAVAEDTREMVLAKTLWLAKRLVDHVDEHRLGFGCMTEELETGDYLWTIIVSYGFEHTFVRAQAEMTAVRADSDFDGLPRGLLAQMLMSPSPTSASFDSNLPRTWLELAYAASEKIR